MHWDGKDRRRTPRTAFDEEQMEELAERAAKRALLLFYGDFYKEVGKVTVRSVLYICGAAGIALAAWLGLTGKLG